MKTIIAALVALTAGLSMLQAQAAPAPGGAKTSTPRAKAAPPLVVATLDANHDGIIDAVEVANASQALKGLDRNADGRLTREEWRRARPARPASSPTTSQPAKRRAKAAMSEPDRR